jgi:hypothetical protein
MGHVAYLAEQDGLYLYSGTAEKGHSRKLIFSRLHPYPTGPGISAILRAASMLSFHNI